jgi:hypothetical protein
MMSEKIKIENNIEPFRLWFEFYKESDADTRAPNVVEKFGQVNEVAFDCWWETHSYMFKDIDPFNIKVLNTKEDFEWFDDDSDIVIMAVNLFESKESLRAAFDEVLQKYHSNKSGPKPFEHLGEIFSLCARPDVIALSTTLKVWRYCKENPHLELHEVEEYLGLITKKGPKKHAHWDQISSPNSLKQQRKTQSDEVNRHLRRAKILIKNVAHGQFPLFE